MLPSPLSLTLQTTHRATTDNRDSLAHNILARIPRSRSAETEVL